MTWGLWGIGVKTAGYKLFDPRTDPYYFDNLDYDPSGDDEDIHSDLLTSWVIGNGMARRKPHIQRGVEQGPAHPGAPLTDTERWMQNMGHEFAKRIHAAPPTEGYTYRGMTVSPDWVANARRKKSVTLPLSSIDYDHDYSSSYTSPRVTRRPGVGVLMRIEPGAKAYRLAESEHITHGDFDVHDMHYATPEESDQYGIDPHTTVMHVRQRSVPSPVGLPGPGERTATTVPWATEVTTAQLPVEVAHHYRWQGYQPNPELTENIRDEGVREALTINTDGVRGYLADGHHRLDSATEAGLSHVPVRVNRIADALTDYPLLEDQVAGLLGGRASHRTAMPYDFTAPAGEFQMPVERNERGHIRVHRGIVVPRSALHDLNHFRDGYGPHWSTNEQISQALADPAVYGESDDDAGLLMSGWYDPSHGTHPDPDPITGGQGYNEHEQEITLKPGTPMHVDRVRWKHPDWNYDHWEDLDWSPRPVTAHRTAMSWYHSSPHDLKPGTILTPGGGGSNYDYESWAPGEGRQDHVWVTGDLDNAEGWAGVSAWDSPDRKGHVYEVEPSEEPQEWDDEGHVVPSARIVRKIKTIDNGPRHAHRTAMPWYHNTDAELNPGDMLLPAAERGYHSPYLDADPDDGIIYHPDKVYMYHHHGEPTQEQLSDDNGPYSGTMGFGKNTYEVEPIGPTERDPEWQTNWDKWGDLYDNETEVPGAHDHMVPRARVVRKVDPRSEPGSTWGHEGYERYYQSAKKARMMTAAVTVYTKPSCPQCDMTHKLLDKLGIDHTTVDVTTDPEAHAYVTGLGYQQAPVVVVGDGEWHWSGFRAERLKELVSGE